MKRFFVFVSSLFLLVAPSWAWSGTPYSIDWQILEENPKCEGAWLANNGGPYFHVNQTPIPTYEVPGAYTKTDAWESNLAKAGFDSVLLRMGDNVFTFSTQASNGNDACVQQHNLVSLVSVPLGIHKPLFDVRRDGTAFFGETTLGLALSEVNPPLAKDIANLEAAIAKERKALVENAAAFAKLDERLSFLRELELELHDLVERPLDEIAQVDLDAILDRYASVVDEETRLALEELLADLKRSVQDLQNELTSLMEEFGAQADAVADLVTANAQASGFSPDDPFNYGLGPSETPWVSIPDLTAVPGAFEPGNDPYAAYADAVIASLEDDVSGGKVINRGSFVATVRAWRVNQRALEKALAAGSGVTQAEVNAFLNAQNRVTSHVKQYMDAADWFLNSSIPPDVRAQVDGVLKNVYGELANQLKDALNEWSQPTLDLTQLMLVENIRAFAGAVSELTDEVMPYVEVMAAITHAATRIGIGFVPFVGPALDLCEAVTGKEWCLPDGRELSTGERIFSGIGFGAPNIGKAWKGASKAAISEGGKKVAAGIFVLPQEVLKWLEKSRITKWKNGVLKLSHGAIDITGEFEANVGLYLMKQKGHKMLAPGDKIVRDLVGIPHDATVKDISVACDYVTVNPKTGKLILSEAKEVLGKQKRVNTTKALLQLNNVMKRLGELNLAHEVEEVLIFTSQGVLNYKGDFKVMGDGRLYKELQDGTKQFVTPTGRPDLIVRVIFL